MTRVIIIRHGQSSLNVTRTIQGRCDCSVLTDFGKQQAAAVGKALADLTFDAIYSSPLQRARDTAEVIFGDRPDTPAIVTSDWLKEIDLPLWEQKTVAEVQRDYPDAYQLWKERPHEFCMELPTGQHFPVLSLFAQARTFWESVLERHAGQTIAIVGHNGINRSLIATALGITPDRYQTLLQSNCGISILNFPGGLGDGVQLESMNLNRHMVGVNELPSSGLPAPKQGDRGPRLLLVRHGETEWNRCGQFQGQIDVPLNDNGRDQARKAGECLQDEVFDLAFSSSMSRPRETAEIILEHHPGIELTLLDDLREISHGLWEGKFEREIEAAYPGLLAEWQTHPERVQMPEGENLEQVWERAERGWRAILEACDRHAQTHNLDRPLNVLVTAHDAVNKAILCQLAGLGPESFWNFKQGNGGVSAIVYPYGSQGLPLLQTVNATGHLAAGVLDTTAAGAL